MNIPTVTKEMIEAAEAVDDLYRMGQPQLWARVFRAMYAAMPVSAEAATPVAWTHPERLQRVADGKVETMWPESMRMEGDVPVYLAAPQASQPIGQPLPRSIGVSRDMESPGAKSVLVAFERQLTDEELRVLHSSLSNSQPVSGAMTDEQIKQRLRNVSDFKCLVQAIDDHTQRF